MRPYLNRVGLSARDTKLREALITYLRIHANLGGFCAVAARSSLMVTPPPTPIHPNPSPTLTPLAFPPPLLREG
jgi:hypothetical protein